jgi:integrase
LRIANCSAREQTDRGKIVLPSEFNRGNPPASLYERPTEDGGSEFTLEGAHWMDKFFKRMPIVDITAINIGLLWNTRDVRVTPIRRPLGRLRSAFYLAKESDLINDSHIPTFRLPRDSDARVGFLDVPDFEKLRDAMLAQLQPTVTFLYYSGFRSGAAAKIAWDVVSKDKDELNVSGKIMKNKKAIIIPLAGPLSIIRGRSL